ncbi:hypothetical protein M513_08888 [Trichuris suis]|uniref:Uncharacterized protein n=1 Tax=Trichuris suis TaxID=68888 RepID=A0A085LZ64_9BILA|nr:hypothetical protein M513_08888 [Trichuris suis]
MGETFYDLLNVCILHSITGPLEVSAAQVELQVRQSLIGLQGSHLCVPLFATSAPREVPEAMVRDLIVLCSKEGRSTAADTVFRPRYSWRRSSSVAESGACHCLGS